MGTMRTEPDTCSCKLSGVFLCVSHHASLKEGCRCALFFFRRGLKGTLVQEQIWFCAAAGVTGYASREIGPELSPVQARLLFLITRVGTADMRRRDNNYMLSSSACVHL